MKNGGPAFPRPGVVGQAGEGIQEGSRGMTLRAWLAGKALLGLCARMTDDRYNDLVEGIHDGRNEARLAVALADRLIEELEAQP